MKVSVLAISFDARNAARLAHFWARALGRTVNDGATDDSASIAADADSELGVVLMFHKVTEGKTVKNRAHFDLQAGDVQPLDQFPGSRRQRVRPGRKRLTPATGSDHRFTYPSHQSQKEKP